MRCVVVAAALLSASLAGQAVAQSQCASDQPTGQTIVWAAQVELARAGLYEGPKDGMMTAETEEAVEEFEHLVGWPESGRVSPDLIMALKRYNLLTVVEDPDS